MIVRDAPGCHESRVRIIAGKAGRLAIKVPGAVARPTTDFVRQALFSILGEKVDDARTLDLFAGSGAIGLEALSRGAASCVFVDEHRQAVSVIGENLAKSRLEGGRVVRSEVSSYLRTDPGSYDLIFADPPYFKNYGDRDHVKELLANPHLSLRLAPGGWFIAEISSSQKSPLAEGWSLLDRREYGGCAILLYAPVAAA
ncbi:16S rRNA (guanine(966)-N(2))-methyltransferase RsmD [Luteolibacter sp. LG18]|uniref:16S rRNA (guanine(966)-N(2))-methyltransferase RsmD n=1 Tax=Luteolibacter sp. LG18 TaxID=2819286 RepID=UPI002B307EBE|nr:methyltransferase small [Luteolibacter sp. LG18]